VVKKNLAGVTVRKGYVRVSIYRCEQWWT